MEKDLQSELRLLDGVGLLAYLPPLYALNLKQMCIIFGKSRSRVMHAVHEDTLPQPFNVFPEYQWLVVEILDKFKELNEAAQERRSPTRAKKKGKPTRLDPGTSPIRRKRDARSS